MDNYGPVQIMTASFMQYCRRFELARFGLVYLLLVFLGSPAWADSSSLNIKSAELAQANDAYVLNADFDIRFSKEVEEALSKGVHLDFLVEFQIAIPSSWWFDDEVKSASTHISLGYHALSRQYLVNRDNHQYAFSTLQEAKEEISQIRNWRVVEKSLLNKDEEYYAALRIRLDQSKLPKPLQVDALGSKDWDMVSERYRWTPALAF
jgi:hypothetical protein